MATRGSYVHKSMVEFSGASRKFSLCNFLRKLMVSDNNKITGVLELKELYKQNH